MRDIYIGNQDVKVKEECIFWGEGEWRENAERSPKIGRYSTSMCCKMPLFVLIFSVMFTVGEGTNIY